ncbi:MAG: hypothetical protein IJQ67_06360 [Bacilli bacterium]|nr:hypothetical protein [Bacilli bacterium]
MPILWTNFDGQLDSCPNCHNKISVEKIYENDADFINSFAFRTAKDGIASNSEEKVKFLE